MHIQIQIQIVCRSILSTMCFQDSLHSIQCLYVYQVGLSSVQYTITFCLEASAATWGNIFWSTVNLFSFISGFFSPFFYPFPFFCVSPTHSVCFSYYLKVHLSAFLFSFLSSSSFHVSYTKVGYMSLTVPPRLSVISGPSETQTSVDPLHMAVKVIWVSPKTHTHTLDRNSS